jgi:hypothetical protein
LLIEAGETAAETAAALMLFVLIVARKYLIS